MIWLPSIAQGRDGIALFSQYLGMSALIAMAISQTIATRIAPVEWIFGGLDRAYVLHKWLGIGALVAILLHDTIDAEMTGLGRETLLVRDCGDGRRDRAVRFSDPHRRYPGDLRSLSPLALDAPVDGALFPVRRLPLSCSS